MGEKRIEERERDGGWGVEERECHRESDEELKGEERQRI